LELRVQPMTTAMLETYVLSKPYFDPHGLIVAREQDQVVGFVHAGFGASEDRSRLNCELGVICMLMLAPHHGRASAIAAELIQRAEDYLAGKGARVIYGGGIHPLNPFYFGLYGGSEMPGVLSRDVEMLDALKENGYKEAEHVVVLERELAGFRPPVNRKTLQVRRKFQIEATFDPPARNWWDACTYGLTDRTRFVLRHPGEEAPACSVTFWDMEPLASSWGVHAVGLVEMTTAQAYRRQGLATFLVGEALRQLYAYGVSRCQVQTMAHNAAARSLYKQLGFAEKDEGIVLRKSG